MLPATSVAIAPIISASATGWRLKSRNAKRKQGGGDVTVDGGTIAVRAEKAERGRARTYALTALATDVAGNVAEGAAECVVPHSQGG